MMIKNFRKLFWINFDSTILVDFGIWISIIDNSIFLIAYLVGPTKFGAVMDVYV